MEIYNKSYDFKKFKRNPEKILCVYFVPRSGSTFLAEEMRKTESLGFPLEYFSVQNMAMLRLRMPDLSRSNLKSLFEKRTSPNGVFSFKWNSNYGQLNILNPTFNIFIDRHDLEAQAAAYITALKSGKWAVNEPGKYNATRQEIISAMATLEDVRVRTHRMIQGERLYLFYEEIIDNPSLAIDGILDCFKIFDDTEEKLYETLGEQSEDIVDG